ncbi:Similar to S.cerevisiae protein YMR074C (Protein with homology to human PDCD5) [Malassezia sympodialis ATCC 42132]|uniref:Similar to S.cerevisiae protein YMR074C (Protein with homology to human PDCD5) n=1 Tax=Malassezia sympodialis (strain ATCC 42132) TaxID=1230383 RepID=A0A1M8A8T7_MALS4|nr:Similar to S.cerevisiae protein YMR074C (Protein with homology to human PDCD5) [Malassezia sympodialis ATCC 42132]
MDDPELEAIRRARLAELRGAQGGSMPTSAGMPSVLQGGSGRSSATDGQDDNMAQQEEMKRQLLSQILESDARERLSRIALVKPQKAAAISDILLQMARSGQVRQRVSEDQLIMLLDQVDQVGANESANKITVSRKKTLDDDDDDWDL